MWNGSITQKVLLMSLSGGDSKTCKNRHNHRHTHIQTDIQTYPRSQDLHVNIFVLHLKKIKKRLLNRKHLSSADYSWLSNKLCWDWLSWQQYKRYICQRSTAVLFPALRHIHWHYNIKFLTYYVLTACACKEGRGLVKSLGNGVHITTASVIESNMTHVFLQQFKWSPEVNRQSRFQSKRELIHNTLRHLKRSSHTKE